VVKSCCRHNNISRNKRDSLTTNSATLGVAWSLRVTYVGGCGTEQPCNSLLQLLLRQNLPCIKPERPLDHLPSKLERSAAVLPDRFTLVFPFLWLARSLASSAFIIITITIIVIVISRATFSSLFFLHLSHSTTTSTPPPRSCGQNPSISSCILPIQKASKSPITTPKESFVNHFSVFSRSLTITFVCPLSCYRPPHG
jgi:hypothetical protein